MDEEGRRKSLLIGGNGEMLQHIEVEANDRIIKLSDISENGKISLSVGFAGFSSYKEPYPVRTQYKIKENEYDHKYNLDYETHCYFSRPMSVDELIDWEENRRTLIENQMKELQPIIDEHNKEIDLKESEKQKKEKEERKLLEAKQKEEDQRKEEDKKKKKLQWEQERNNWIDQFGSQYLKDATDLDYNIDDKYFEERATKEFPKYEINFYYNAGWNIRSNPSQKALNEVKELVKKNYDAVIVWLTAPVNEEEKYYDDFEECEAIVIRSYLGKYDLVKEIE